METKKPRFDLGQTAITRKRLRLLRQEAAPIAGLGSHALQVTGVIPPRRSAEGNERAIEEPGPVVSIHESLAAGTRFYVLTDAERSQTTIFMRGEVR